MYAAAVAAGAPRSQAFADRTTGRRVEGVNPGSSPARTRYLVRSPLTARASATRRPTTQRAIVNPTTAAPINRARISPDDRSKGLQNQSRPPPAQFLLVTRTRKNA